jgi:hypothetical protein
VVRSAFAEGSLKRFAYIDALRGYAILGVILVHTSQYSGFDSQAAFGARGVQLFFVASALTLMFSWHERHDGATAFFVWRIFRIVPMFWVSIPIYLGFQFRRTHDTGRERGVVSTGNQAGLDRRANRSGGLVGMRRGAVLRHISADRHLHQLLLEGLRFGYRMVRFSSILDTPWERLRSRNLSDFQSLRDRYLGVSVVS